MWRVRVECICFLRVTCVTKGGLGGLPKGITALRSSSQERALLLRKSHTVAGHRGQLRSIRHPGWRRWQYRLRDAIEPGTVKTILQSVRNVNN